MATISITVHTASAYDGWTQEDRDRLDVLDTEANLAQVLENEIREATGVEEVKVSVRSEDRGDFWSINGAADAMEQRDLDEIVRETLNDFPWHEAQRWGVFK
jgi:tricorn protease-like protein